MTGIRNDIERILSENNKFLVSMQLYIISTMIFHRRTHSKSMDFTNHMSFLISNAATYFQQLNTVKPA